MTVVVTGTFDGLHKGHEDLFRQAKALGDRLVVIVGRDATVEAVKGRRPRQGEAERLAVVRAHPLVSAAILGGAGEDKLAVLEEVRPDVILLGYDQQAFTEGLAEALAARGLHPRIVRGVAFEPERYKSSLLYEKKQNG
jgi:FAD synthetase